MNDYLQPDFYRFNQDSLELVRFVLKKRKSAQDILDLGAGVGVIGIELANVLRPKSLTLLDAQKEYLPFALENLKTQLKEQLHCRFIEKSFGEWSPDLEFDLIVCNPPYYLPGRGQPSLNPHREMARSFVKDNWEILLDLILKSLKEDGEAYLVIKKDQTILSAIKDYLFGLTLEVTDSENLSFLKLTRLNKN